MKKEAIGMLCIYGAIAVAFIVFEIREDRRREEYHKEALERSRKLFNASMDQLEKHATETLKTPSVEA